MTYSGSSEPRARRKLASLNLIHLVAAMLCSSTVNSAPHAQTALWGGAIATSDIYGARAAREIMNERGNVADAAVAGSIEIGEVIKADHVVALQVFGSVSANVLVENFLGRPQNFDAFQKWLGQEFTER